MREIILIQQKKRNTINVIDMETEEVYNHEETTKNIDINETTRK